MQKRIRAAGLAVLRELLNDGQGDERMLAAGSTAFKVNRGDGRPDEKVTDFSALENETIVVPRVVGLRLRQARARVRKRHCRVGHVSRRHSKRVGRVLAQHPRPGRRLASGSRVNLVVGRK